MAGSHLSLRFALFFLSICPVYSQLPPRLESIASTTAQDLATSCPGQVTKLSPCITSSADLSNCTSCVTEYTAEVTAEEVNETAANTDVDSSVSKALGQETNNQTSYTCEELQEDVCQGIAKCGTSCGVVNEDSFFTFGAECEGLFLDLIDCVLKSQGVIGSDCSVASSACTSGDNNSEGDKDPVDDLFRGGAGTTTSFLSGAVSSVLLVGSIVMVVAGEY
mmetsp:Transcript_5978/g.11107  ORF Transcript_5978/g.11107 Transcript_5978/m.11107 type:complete len:221 (+) Transcript_5978:112-774(+)